MSSLFGAGGASASGSQPITSVGSVYRSELSSSVTGATTSDTAYFVYVGYVPEAITITYVKLAVTGGGTGAQTAELGLFSTPAAPNGANQTVTKIAATGSVNDLTTTGVKGNASSFAQSVSAGTHLWAGFRTAMASTQPTCASLTRDYSNGAILSTAAAGALTGSGPWTGALIAHAITAQAPDLTVVRY